MPWRRDEFFYYYYLINARLLARSQPPHQSLSQSLRANCHCNGRLQASGAGRPPAFFFFWSLFFFIELRQIPFLRTKLPSAPPPTRTPPTHFPGACCLLHLAPCLAPRPVDSRSLNLGNSLTFCHPVPPEQRCNTRAAPFFCRYCALVRTLITGPHSITGRHSFATGRKQQLARLYYPHFDILLSAGSVARA
jgi:hypothetical protein